MVPIFGQTPAYHSMHKQNRFDEWHNDLQLSFVWVIFKISEQLQNHWRLSAYETV